jgi:hypothetical protein
VSSRCVGQSAAALAVYFPVCLLLGLSKATTTATLLNGAAPYWLLAALVHDATAWTQTPLPP